ncbi:anti-sigma factor domain-containing protein [Paradesulfitobacterium ferrireducens]|uniref:anti-sigma factor domain-containing protein n=1 Tax=Paradesulfitobacterium ferrireducens TaxID=2816476 RepID=UPI001A8EC024|nr:anti-sigma factor domain-containing protein [Paradesulfitobacterium ferrireducens]
MEQTKGIVMRTSNKTTVIYTEKGDFYEIPTPKEVPLVGQTIEINLNSTSLSQLKTFALKYAAAAAVLLLALSISAFYLLYLPNKAVASVALDLNQGIELLVNREGKVIKAQNVNGASTLLEGLSVKGSDIYQAVDLILENAHNKGTLNQTQNLVLARVIPLSSRGDQMIDTESLRNTIRDELLRSNLSGNVVVGKADEATQLEARKHGMTVNSYLIYERSQQQGVEIQPDTLRNDLQKALNDAKISVPSLFPEENLEVKQNAPIQTKPMDQHGQPSYLEPNLSPGSASGSSPESGPADSSSLIEQLPGTNILNQSGITSDIKVPGSK